ncbi:MAG: hypothetical protein PVG07_05930 [Acidobacteriota bacterium]|jgi:hypothetical protein
MGRLLIRILLVLGLALATWGLVITVPPLLGAEPGYLARSLYLVIVWGLIWISCLVVLVRSFR